MNNVTTLIYHILAIVIYQLFWLCSYPQRIKSFFPTLLSFVAVIANFWMFWDHPTFLCLHYELVSGGYNYGTQPK